MRSLCSSPARGQCFPAADTHSTAEVCVSGVAIAALLGLAWRLGRDPRSCSEGPGSGPSVCAGQAGWSSPDPSWGSWGGLEPKAGLKSPYSEASRPKKAENRWQKAEAKVPGQGQQDERPPAAPCPRDPAGLQLRLPSGSFHTNGARTWSRVAEDLGDVAVTLQHTPLLCQSP